MFSAVLLNHFANPRNAGVVANANAGAEVTNPGCGDVLQLSAAIENGVVREIRFLCRGCTAAIACASLLTESVQGREVRELESLTAQSLATALGGVPEASFHAAQLSIDALHALLSGAPK